MGLISPHEKPLQGLDSYQLGQANKYLRRALPRDMSACIYKSENVGDLKL